MFPQRPLLGSPDDLLFADLPPPPSLNAGTLLAAAPAVPLRKREPIPIVDPRSGSNVPAVPTKPRGAVPIVNPASGEAVVLAVCLFPTTHPAVCAVTLYIYPEIMFGHWHGIFSFGRLQFF